MCSSLKAGALLFLILNTLYPLWIIGLNQDSRSDGQGMAGLTFMFQKSPDKRQYNNSATQNVGWLQSSIGTYLNNGGSLCPSVKNALVKVRKTINEGSIQNIAPIHVNAFMLSPYEIDSSKLKGMTGSGVGHNHDELYLFIEKNNIASSAIDRAAWGLSGNKMLRGIIWKANINLYGAAICTTGDVTYDAGLTGFWDYLPAFCL